MSAVDVLGAMDDAGDELDAIRAHSKTLREARAAVAELIHVVDFVADGLAKDVQPAHPDFINKANAAKKLRAALAHIGTPTNSA